MLPLAIYFKILIESKGVSDVKAKRAAIWERVKARFNAKHGQEAPWSLKKLKDLRYRMLNGNQQKKDKEAVSR